MYSMIVKANSISELKNKMLKLGNAIDDYDDEEAEAATAVHERSSAALVQSAADPAPNKLTEMQVLSRATRAPAAPSFPAVQQSFPVVAPAAPQVAQPPVGDRDTRGLPWDERIHASSKTVNKDGTWRFKRGVEQAEIDAVEAQLRAGASHVSAITPSVPAQPAQAVQPVPVVPPPPAPVSLPPTSPFGAQPTVAVAPQVPASPFQAPASVPQSVGVAQPSYQDSVPVPPQTEQKPAHSLETFKANLPMALAGLIKAGKLPQEYVQQLKDYFKVGEIWEIVKNESHVSELFEQLCHHGLITKVG